MINGTLQHLHVCMYCKPQWHDGTHNNFSPRNSVMCHLKLCTIVAISLDFSNLLARIQICHLLLHLNSIGVVMVPRRDYVRVKLIRSGRFSSSFTASFRGSANWWTWLLDDGVPFAPVNPARCDSTYFSSSEHTFPPDSTDNKATTLTVGTSL